MRHLDIIRAWKDEEYRLRLSGAERAQLPEHPAGVIELLEPESASVQGGFGCAHTSPYGKWSAESSFRALVPYRGGCGVDMSCLPEADSGGGICGVNMSCR
jgi:mersacidin/lichenicidin family type 2 lantibiotic